MCVCGAFHAGLATSRAHARAAFMLAIVEACGGRQNYTIASRARKASGLARTTREHSTYMYIITMIMAQGRRRTQNGLPIRGGLNVYVTGYKFIAIMVNLVEINSEKSVRSGDACAYFRSQISC